MYIGTQKISRVYWDVFNIESFQMKCNINYDRISIQTRCEFPATWCDIIWFPAKQILNKEIPVTPWNAVNQFRRSVADIAWHMYHRCITGIPSCLRPSRPSRKWQFQERDRGGGYYLSGLPCPTCTYTTRAAVKFRELPHAITRCSSKGFLWGFNLIVTGPNATGSRAHCSSFMETPAVFILHRLSDISAIITNQPNKNMQ